MTNIRRYDPTGGPVFITAVCHRRVPYLKTDWQKELLLSVMREVKSSSGFAMNAYVIMDDHFHWIITPRKQNFSMIMQSIKLWIINGHRSTRMWIWGIITLNGGLIPFQKQFTPWN